MTYITKHNGDHDPNLTTSVIFSHYELNTVDTNWNEHEEEEDEEKFLNQQYVTICQEYYSEPEGERFMLHLRQIGHFDTKIVLDKKVAEDDEGIGHGLSPRYNKIYKDRRDGIRVLFLQVKAQTIGEYEIKHDMLIVGVNGDVEIWYDQSDDGVPKFVDYELHSGDNHLQILERISEVLRHLATQQYVYYFNSPGIQGP